MSDPRSTARNTARSSRTLQKPLIDLANNRWQDSKSPSVSEDEDEAPAKSRPGLNRGIFASRRFRRMLLILFLLLGLVFWAWRWHLRPTWLQEWEYMEGFLTGHNGTYGIAKAGHFDGTRIRNLDSRLLPGGKHDRESKRRLVFVGDIHGCADELHALLKKADFDESTDHLIAVGDVISKGPKNTQVLDTLMRLHADTVRGNHEDRILAIDPATVSSDLTAEISSKGAVKDIALLRQLNKAQLAYLHDMPLILRIPALPLALKPTRKTHSPIAEDILVVHAGLVPALSLPKQDPYYVMNMRAIHSKTHLPLDEAAEERRGAKSKPWHQIWEWYNARLFARKSLKHFRAWEPTDIEDATRQDDRSSTPTTSSWPTSWLASWSSRWAKPKPQVVVYGHHSKEGLQMSRWSKGLDTGCVRGGKLTALILNARGQYEIMHVDCEDHRD